MRSEEEIYAKIHYLEAQSRDLSIEDEMGNWAQIAACDNDVVLLRWVLGELEL